MYAICQTHILIEYEGGSTSLCSSAKWKWYEATIAKTLKCEACEGVLQWLDVDAVQVDEVGLTQ